MEIEIKWEKLCLHVKIIHIYFSSREKLTEELKPAAGFLLLLWDLDAVNTYRVTIPDGYTSWQLPPDKYVVCTFEEENFESLVMDVLYKVAQYLYAMWLLHHKLQTEAFCAERYESHTPQTSMMEVWMQLVS